MLKMVAGKDATQHFEELHKPEILTSIGSEYKIGVVGDGPEAGAGTLAAAEPEEAEVVQLYTEEEVDTHNTRNDMWIMIDGGVYDVTEFAEDHPGGVGMLKMVAGKDASLHFEELHKPEILTTIGAAFKIGEVRARGRASPQSGGESLSDNLMQPW